VHPDRSLILDAAARAVFHTAIVFAVFLLFAGHNAPGGGFVGGLVAGAALTLRHIEGGADELRRLVRVDPIVLLGVGLTIVIATAVAPWFVGNELLESGKVEVDVPVIGTLKTTSALPFDIGVFVVVVALISTILATLGAEDDA
jgi:multisubunit Na+/H+ antiporter MnhB subunit